jgi:L-arabinose isomerase
MIDLKKFEIWFVTGSQHLYGAVAFNRRKKSNGKSQLV